MTAHPMTRWLVSIAALGSFALLATGSASSEMEAAFEEAARKVEEEERSRQAQEELLLRGSADTPTAAATTLSHDPSVETVEHGNGTGTVTTKSGASVTMGIAGTPPPKGASVALKIRVLQNLFGADVEAELEVGTAEVTAVTADAIGMTITEEKSKISVDGDELDHLSEGSEILLSW